MGLFDLNPAMYDSFNIDAPLLCENTITLRELMPKYYFDDYDDTTHRFVDIFQGVFCQWMSDIDGLLKIYDLDLTDEKYLDMIIRNLGFDLNVSLTATKKRKLAKVIIEAYKLKGTCPGIENTIRQFVGVDAKCFAFTDGWILDVSELSFDTYLNPAPDNLKGFYTFDVVVQQKLSTEQRRIIIELIKLIKPAHTHFRQLVEEGVDTFVISVLKMLNKGSLWLRNNQNDDGGWDATIPDGNTANASSIQNVGYHGLSQLFVYNFNTELEVVNQAFQDAATKLINDAVYSFSGIKPREGDIMLLNRAEIAGVLGADTKRDEAIDAIYEFIKAMAFLNNFNPTLIEVANTTPAERDSTSLRNRAKFLYLWQTNQSGLAVGIFRYVKWMRDFREIGNDPQAIEFAAELAFRLGGVNFQEGLGNYRIGALASIVWGLQQYNTGFVYESVITQALDIISLDFQAAQKLYFNTDIGTGRIIEQGIVIDALMSKNRFDETKLLLDGLRLIQRVDGSFDDPLAPGAMLLRDAAVVLDAASRAIKRIEDEGL